MYAWSIGYFIGVILLQLPYLTATGVFIGSLLVVYCFYCSRKYRFIIAMIIGVIVTFLHLYSYNNNALPRDVINKTIFAEGRVEGFPVVHENTVQFNFIIHAINHQTVTPRLVKLQWYFTNTVLSPGQEWRLDLQLKPPHGLSNPGSSNSEGHYKAEGIVAVGHVVSKANNQLLANHWSIDQWRETISQRLDRFTEISYLRFIKALTLGITMDLRAEDWKILQATGTSHLVAISGLHVGLVAGFVFVLFRSICCFFPRLLLRGVSFSFAAIAAIMSAIAYSALAGFSLPTQRALIMLCVYMGGKFCRREFSPWSAWCLALLIVLFINPFNVLLPGFWLSFSAVASIIIICQLYQKSSLFFQKIRMQWMISILLLPLTVLFFHQFSLTSPLVNLIVIPWIGLLVVPLSLIALGFIFNAPAIAHFLLCVCDKLIAVFWNFLNFFSNLSSGVHWNPGPWWVFASLGVGVMLWALPRGVPGRFLSIISVIPLFFHTTKPAYGALDLTVLDVGQGLAIVAQTQDHVVVYDAGPSVLGFNAGDRIVAPFLNFYQIKKIDLLMISHKDNDHSGGMVALLNQFPVARTLTSYQSPLCYQGQEWRWEGVEFSVLAPLPHIPYQGNNSSCVLKIAVNNTNILLTGDIEQESEESLLKHYPDLKASILIAPHHGSKTSSTSNFVKTVHPEFVIFSTGYYNRFHFPHPSIVNRYKKINATMLDTAFSGAIHIKINEKGKIISVAGYR